MNLRPSSLPMLQKCSQFTGTGSDYTESGTDRHGAFKNALEEKPDALALLDEEDASGVSWAVEYVRTHAPMEDHGLDLERTLTLYDGEFNRVFTGTPDVICGSHVFDLKWRHRDYGAQIAAYALMHMEESGRNSVTVHVLFAATKRAEVYELTRGEAGKLVHGIIHHARERVLQPSPNEYCGWCSKRLTCAPFQEAARVVAAGYSDIEKAKTWHPSEMETGEEIATALWLWRTVLKKWGESVEFHAMDAATKRGLTLPGFELKSKKGRQWCKDMEAAFTASKLPQNFFLMCCDLRMNTSKTSAGKKGLIDMYAGTHGMPKARAKRELTDSLTTAGALEDGKPSQYLKATGEEDDSAE